MPMGKRAYCRTPWVGVEAEEAAESWGDLELVVGAGEVGFGGVAVVMVGTE
jgi:hypothetical protein